MIDLLMPKISVENFQKISQISWIYTRKTEISQLFAKKSKKYVQKKKPLIPTTIYCKVD
jgi:hypothetical protein